MIQLLFFASAFLVFLGIALLVPIGYGMLVKTKVLPQSEGQSRGGLTTAFIVLGIIWLIVSCLVGLALVLIFGFFIFLNAHAQATTGHRVTDKVPVLVIVITYGIIGSQVFVGWLMHRYIKQAIG